jgi:RimJ/RimL family protein N-acetyltransferase
MFKGSLVKLRHQSLEDQATMAAFLNEEHVMETRCHDLPKFSYKEQLEKEYKQRFEKHDDNSLHMAIETLEGKLIGAVGIEFVFWKNGFAYMYQFIGDKDYLEGGYREEAIKLFSDFAFMEGNIRKLKTAVQANDTLGLKAYEANDFEIEVTHKEETLCHGKYLDVYEMVKFR